jgi:hypothetical protein
LSSKPGLLAAVEELEKMTGALKDALKEELATAAAEARAKALAEVEAGAERCRRSRLAGGRAAMASIIPAAFAALDVQWLVCVQLLRCPGAAAARGKKGDAEYAAEREAAVAAAVAAAKKEHEAEQVLPADRRRAGRHSRGVPGGCWLRYTRVPRVCRCSLAEGAVLPCAGEGGERGCG